MFIHHLATLALLTLSWSNHMHRMGSLVLIVHDFADHWLEMAKLLRYAGWAKSCDACFGIFTLVWAFSRLGLFPSWVCYSTITGAGQVELTSDLVDRQECKMFKSMSSVLVRTSLMPASACSFGRESGVPGDVRAVSLRKSLKAETIPTEIDGCASCSI